MSGPELSEAQRAMLAAAQGTADRVLRVLGARGIGGAYVAEVTVETEGRLVELIVGEGTLVTGGVTLVDWRSSALGAACLRHEPGEGYELEIRGRRGGGKVRARRFVAFDGQGLCLVDGEAGRIERTEGGWQSVDPGSIAPLYPEEQGDGSVRLAMPEAIERFDPRQERALHHPADEPLLISGGAGSGKTTVALHRLARLHRAAPARFPRKDMQVVVSEVALARLAAAVLRELGLTQVDTATAQGWLARQAKRVLLDRPKSVLAPRAAIVALKRHPAVRALLPGFVAELGTELAGRLDRQLAGRGQIAARWAALPGDHLLVRLDALEALLVEESPESLRHEVVTSVRRERRRLFRVREDVLELFGDARRMQGVVAASNGLLGPNAAAEVVAHTRAQLRATSDERFADIDDERKQTLDARGLDEGTPDELASSGDPEDDAIALELLRLKVGESATRRGKVRAPALLLVDEAQDLAAIELGVLGHARRADGSLTVSGDDAQQMASGAAFPGWEAVLEELRAPAAARVALVRNHRSRAPIVAFAAAVLGPLGRPEEAAAPGGAPVLVSATEDPARAALLVSRTLLTLRERRPEAAIAILTARAETARSLHAVLSPELKARLCLAGEAASAPGVCVSTVVQVKGLEFEVVVVPDASAAEYPATDGARRRLYVACSRAIEQLWVIAPGERSPILPSVDG